MKTAFEHPAYLTLYHSGILQERASEAFTSLARCDLCPHCCHSDRIRDPSTAFCNAGPEAKICSYGPHHGEETPLVGRHGSGTIFFSHCNLHCVFCQNWEISQRGDGRTVSSEALADIMLELQAIGCHNINLVSPTHYVAPILQALVIAAGDGLKLPLVYNSGGYDSLDTLKRLDGIVDIYMPDMKFADSKTAQTYLGVADYAEVNRAAVLEMFRQVGHLSTTRQGIARRGLLIRHLVLPDNLAGTKDILGFIAGSLGQETYLNLMDQYRPCHLADRSPPLQRRVTALEFNLALKWAADLGLKCPGRHPSFI